MLLNFRPLFFSYRNSPHLFFLFFSPSFWVFSLSSGWPTFQEPLEGRSVNRGNSSVKAYSPRLQAVRGEWHLLVWLIFLGQCLSSRPLSGVCLPVSRWVLGAPVRAHGGCITRQSRGAGRPWKGSDPYFMTLLWVIKQQAHHAVPLVWGGVIVNGDEKKLIIVQLSSTFSLKSSKTNSIINVLDCGKRKLSLCRGQCPVWSHRTR